MSSFSLNTNNLLYIINTQSLVMCGYLLRDSQPFSSREFNIKQAFTQYFSNNFFKSLCIPFRRKYPKERDLFLFKFYLIPSPFH